MGTNHTPGPWHHKDDEVFSFRNSLVCDCGGFSDSKANARLIAAAPELLEALKLLCQHSDSWKPDVWNNARSAIAKAEGK